MAKRTVKKYRILCPGCGRVRYKTRRSKFCSTECAKPAQHKDINGTMRNSK